MSRLASLAFDFAASGRTHRSDGKRRLTGFFFFLQTTTKLHIQSSHGSGRKPPHANRDGTLGAQEDFPSSISAHLAFIARRIAFGAGAAAAFFMPLRIARIAFAIVEGERRETALTSSFAEIFP